MAQRRSAQQHADIFAAQQPFGDRQLGGVGLAVRAPALDLGR
jgi:hypothetical protein